MNDIILLLLLILALANHQCDHSMVPHCQHQIKKPPFPSGEGASPPNAMSTCSDMVTYHCDPRLDESPRTMYILTLSLQGLEAGGGKWADNQRQIGEVESDDMI